MKKIKKIHPGIEFEEKINKTCEYLIEKDLAVIYKKPTPIQVVKVSYPLRSKAKIIEAYYRIPSTTDYNGIYKGKYIDFEAKSCAGTSFSFESIYPHQINHLKIIDKHGGIGFLIIEFRKYNKVFILDIKKLLTLYLESKTGGRKSIPYSYFLDEGTIVSINQNDLLDILNSIDNHYHI